MLKFTSESCKLYLTCVVCWWANVWVWVAGRIHRLLPWMRKADESRGESYPSIGYCCVILRRYRAILIYYRGNIRKSLHRSTKYTQSITGKRHAITWNGSGKQKRGKRGKRESVHISNFHRDSAYTASRLITAINRRTVYSLIDPPIGFDI